MKKVLIHILWAAILVLSLHVNGSNSEKKFQESARKNWKEKHKAIHYRIFQTTMLPEIMGSDDEMYEKRLLETLNFLLIDYDHDFSFLTKQEKENIYSDFISYGLAVRAAYMRGEL